MSTRLLHLAAARDERSLRRNGLRGQPVRISAIFPGKTEPVTVDLPEVVYTMPVLPDFATTHQWVREMRHWGGGRVLGVHVRVTRATIVYVGRFGGPHFALPIGDACRWVTAHPNGAEILVPRSFSAKEILALRPIVPLVGWRETPANDRSWSCLCDGCVPRGMPNLQRRLIAAITKNLYDARIAAQSGVARDGGPTSPAAVVGALARCLTPLERLRSPARVFARADFARFVGPAGTGDPAVEAAAKACLAFFPPVASR